MPTIADKRKHSTTSIAMLTKRTRQIIAAAALALCCSNKQNQASALRATRQQQQDDANHQPSHIATERNLGDVIIVDGSTNTDYKIEQAYPEYIDTTTTANAAGAATIDYDYDLPMVRSGPHLSDEMIDIRVKTDDTKSRNDIVMTDRIVGGSEVGPRSYYAMLLYRDTAGWKFAGCGATLITNCHVVTAAHCVEDRNFDIEGIYQNAYMPYDGNSGQLFHFTTAQKIFVPQEYDDFTNQNDIAIIRMSQCVNITEYPPALPASPYNQQVSNGDMLELYGFGRLGENVGESGDTKKLRMAQLPYISNQQCKNYFGSKIKYGMFCAGYPQTGGVDACQGDSGSGIFLPAQNANDPPILMGVVSWGVGCARAGYPGVYANVEDFYEWIKTNACNDPDLDPSISWCEDTNFISGNALMMRQTECSQNYRCDACEGHCRSDQECSGSLECFKRSYEAPFQLIPGCVGTGVATRNYCYDPNLSRFAQEQEQQQQEDADKELLQAYHETAKAISQEQAERTSNYYYPNNNMRGGTTRRKPATTRQQRKRGNNRWN